MAKQPVSLEPSVLDRCPVCAGPMESGFLWGGVMWVRQRPSNLWGPAKSGEGIFGSGMGFEPSCAAQRCPACKIYVFRHT